MKTLKTALLVLAFTLVGFGAMTAQNNKVKGPKIEFNDLIYDFGTITVGDKGEFEIGFKNGGTEPLLLQNVQGCCGTSVLDYTKEPVMPKKSGFIRVKIYTGGVAAVISKVITINSNDPADPTVRLTLKGAIKAKEAE